MSSPLLHSRVFLSFNGAAGDAQPGKFGTVVAHNRDPARFQVRLDAPPGAVSPTVDSTLFRWLGVVACEERHPALGARVAVNFQGEGEGIWKGGHVAELLEPEPRVIIALDGEVALKISSDTLQALGVVWLYDGEALEEEKTEADRLDEVEDTWVFENSALDKREPSSSSAILPVPSFATDGVDDSSSVSEGDGTAGKASSMKTGTGDSPALAACPLEVPAVTHKTALTISLAAMNGTNGTAEAVSKRMKELTSQRAGRQYQRLPSLMYKGLKYRTSAVTKQV